MRRLALLHLACAIALAEFLFAIALETTTPIEEHDMIECSVQSSAVDNQSKCRNMALIQKHTVREQTVLPMPSASGGTPEHMAKESLVTATNLIEEAIETDAMPELLDLLKKKLQETETGDEEASARTIHDIALFSNVTLPQVSLAAAMPDASKKKRIARATTPHHEMEKEIVASSKTSITHAAKKSSVRKSTTPHHELKKDSLASSKTYTPIKSKKSPLKVDDKQETSTSTENSDENDDDEEETSTSTDNSDENDDEQETSRSTDKSDENDDEQETSRSTDNSNENDDEQETSKSTDNSNDNDDEHETSKSTDNNDENDDEQETSTSTDNNDENDDEQETSTSTDNNDDNDELSTSADDYKVPSSKASVSSATDKHDNSDENDDEQETSTSTDNNDDNDELSTSADDYKAPSSKASVSSATDKYEPSKVLGHSATNHATTPSKTSAPQVDVQKKASSKRSPAVKHVTPPSTAHDREDNLASSKSPKIPVLETHKVKAAASQSEVERLVTTNAASKVDGSKAALNEAGYKQVVKLHDKGHMKKFLRRIVRKAGLFIADEDGLDSTASSISRGKGVRKYEDLIDTVAAAAAEHDSWVTIISPTVKAAARPDEPAFGPGLTAPLNQDGYVKVAELKSNSEMKVFIQRIINRLGFTVKNKYGLQGIVPWFNGENATQSYRALQIEIQNTAMTPGQWVTADG